MDHRDTLNKWLKKGDERIMRRIRILVCVSETAHVLSAIELAFGEDEYDVTVKLDIQTALEALRQERIDLMITDLSMLTEEAFIALRRHEGLNATTTLMVLSEECRPLFVVDGMQNIQAGLDIASF